MTARLVATGVVVASLLVAAVVAGVPAATVQTGGIQASPETAAIGEEVTFSAPGVDADTYEWDFGDDTTTPTGSTVTHEYFGPGTYTVTLETETDGETATYETTVTVEPTFANVTQVDPKQIIRSEGTPYEAGVKVDVYAIEVPPNHHFTVAATSPGGRNLRVFDADGQQVAESILFRDSISVGATAPPDGETYYIATRRWGDPQSSMRLEFSEHIPPDEFEPNQNLTTAAVRSDETKSGVVSAADREDWFAVESGPGPIEVRATLRGGAQTQPNLDIGLYDSNGTYIGEVGASLNRTRANDASSRYFAGERAFAQTEGIYYVRVRAVTSEDPISPDSTPRVYDLSVDTQPVEPPSVGSAPPTDPDGDGRYEDVNGDGVVDMVDVQMLFDNLDASAVRDKPWVFDFNDDGTISVVDVQALYVESNET